MSDLGREEIEAYKAGISKVPTAWGDIICDMALAKKDAEERVAKLERALAEKEPPAGKYCYVADKRRKQAEAECERLRDALGKFYGLSNDLLCRKDPKGLLEACADAQKALVPTDGEPCDVCGGEGRRALPNATNTIVHHPFCTACKGTGKVPHTPEQAEGEPQLCPTCRQSDQPLAIYYVCDGCGRGWKEVENGNTDNPYAEPNTPEQAHGDALSRLHQAARGRTRSIYLDTTHTPDADAETVRQALTASGVPEDNND